MKETNILCETACVEERDMALALRDMFASIARSGTTEDPLSVVCKSAVRCLPDVQFAYYCYKGEKTGHIAAVREGNSFFMPSPEVECQIVTMLRRLARREEVAVLTSKATRPLLPPSDRKRWKDYAGFSLRVSDGVDTDAAILALFMPPDYAATARHCTWMGLLTDVASSYLARHRAFDKTNDVLLVKLENSRARGKKPKIKFRDSALESWVKKGLASPCIKALVGVRGSCKSFVLQAIRERILATGVAEDNIVTIDCEDASFRRFKTARDMLKYLEEFPTTQKMRYLFIDEPSMIRWHAELLKTLQKIQGWNVWLASSTAHALQTEGARPGNQILLHRLWTDSSVPRSRVRLEKYWCQIFMRDAIGSGDHPDIRTKEALAEYYSDHLGEVKSLSEVSRGLKPLGQIVSRSSIAGYRQSLIDAYLIDVSEIYDVFSGEVVSSISGRVFFTDLELRMWRYGSAPEHDAVRLALNRLYLDLRRKHDKVYTPRDGEADFVTIEPNHKPKLWTIPEDPLNDPARFRLNIRRR